MLKQTDLQAVKRFATTLLYLDIKPTELAPVKVIHPFTDSGFTGLPGADGKTRIADILTNVEDRDQWRNMMREKISNAKSVMDLAGMITIPYMLAFFKFAAPLSNLEDYSRLLAYFWTHSENPNSDPNLPKSRLLRMFKSADPHYLMSEAEYATFTALPDLVEVYRGVTSKNKADMEKALCWTLSEDTARWFANRYGEQGEVWKAWVTKEHIYAYFGVRCESEVICDPKWVNSYIQIA